MLRAAHIFYRKGVARSLHQAQVLRASLVSTKNLLPSRSRLRKRLVTASLRAVRRFLSLQSRSSETRNSSLDGIRLHLEQTRATVRGVRALPRRRRLQAKRSTRRHIRSRTLARAQYLAVRGPNRRLAAQCNHTTRGANYTFIAAVATKPARLRRTASRLKVVPSWLKPQSTRRILGQSPSLPGAVQAKRSRASTYARRLTRQQLLRGAVYSTNSTFAQAQSGSLRVGALPAVSYAKYATAMPQALRLVPRVVPVRTLVRATFLSRVGPIRGARSAGNLQTAHRCLDALQRRLRERRFYLQRPRLRLPQTTVTRHRRRRGGLGLFVRHSLKTPQTRIGAVSQLLPPPVAYSHLRTAAEVGACSASSDFIEASRHDDLKPRI